MAMLTLSTSMSTKMPVYDQKPGSYHVGKNDSAATTIQTAARVYLAKKRWEELYVQRIEMEVLCAKVKAQNSSNRTKKRKYLDEKATILQTLARGYIVRNRYRKGFGKSDRTLSRSDDAVARLSLMSTVRIRMDIRKRIETLKKQISDVRATKGGVTDSDSEDPDEVSLRKAERLKSRHKQLQIKAKTLEAVTRPLQKKFGGLRAEHEKLRKKFRKVEAKNESRRKANDESTEELEVQLQSIKRTKEDLEKDLSSVSLEKASLERARVEQKLDAMVETSNAYARLGLNEDDASVFANEVSRIGREAHRKAKLFRDSMRSHMASKYGSNRNITNLVEADRSNENKGEEKIAIATKATLGTTRTMSPGRDPAQPPALQRRGHGRVLSKLLSGRSNHSYADSEHGHDRSVSPTLQRRDGNFSNKMMRREGSQGSFTLLRREGSQGSFSNASFGSNDRPLLRREKSQGSFSNASPGSNDRPLLRREKSQGSFSNASFGSNDRPLLRREKSQGSFSNVTPETSRPLLRRERSQSSFSNVTPSNMTVEIKKPKSMISVVSNTSLESSKVFLRRERSQSSFSNVTPETNKPKLRRERSQSSFSNVTPETNKPKLRRERSHGSFSNVTPESNKPSLGNLDSFGNTPKISNTMLRRERNQNDFCNTPETNKPTLRREGSPGSLGKTPKTSNKLSKREGSPGSLGKTPKTSNKLSKREGSPGSLGKTPKTSNKLSKRGGSPGSLGNTPKTSNTLLRREGSQGSFGNTPKTSNTHESKKPRRRISSADVRTPILQLQQRDLGLRKVRSERKMGSPLSTPTSRLSILRKELREECRSNARKELRDEVVHPRRKSSTKASPRTSKKSQKKEKSPKPSKEKLPKLKKKDKSLTPKKSKLSIKNEVIREELPAPSVAGNTFETGGLVGRKKSTPQPRRIMSLAVPSIDIRKGKRSYLRKATSLTESAKGRRKLVDVGMSEVQGGGMMPDLKRAEMRSRE